MSGSSYEVRPRNKARTNRTVFRPRSHRGESALFHATAGYVFMRVDYGVKNIKGGSRGSKNHLPRNDPRSHRGVKRTKGGSPPLVFFLRLDIIPAPSIEYGQ